MKNFKSVLVFLLSLIIVFSAFPSTVFAENSLDECTIFYDINDTTVGDHKKGTLPFNYTFATISGYSSYRFSYAVHPVGTASDEGSLSVTFDVILPTGCSYQKVSSICILSKNNEILENTISGTVSSEGNIFTCNFSFSEKADIHQVSLTFDNVTFTGSKTVGLKSCTYDVTTVGGLLNKIVSFFGDLFARLTAWFDSLFQWLKDIRDGNISFAESVKTLFSNITNSIKGFFSELGTKLSDGFKNLTNSISTFFTNLGNNLKDWFDDVGQWFTDIGDRIGEFFTSLWNKIWYGNEKGESEYQKPVINNKFNDILDTLSEYQEQLKGTISTISASADSVSSYISTGTQLVNGVINVAGAGFTALIVFGMVFVLVRKVVGR